MLGTHLFALCGIYHIKPIIKTLSVRIRDKHVSVLSRMVFDVNQVWNAANADSAEFLLLDHYTN